MTGLGIPDWYWHAVAGSTALLLAILAAVTGAMLRGRLRRPRGMNVFAIHRGVAVAFVAVLIATFPLGHLAADEFLFGLPQELHGWLGLAIIILGLGQLVPSLLVGTRKRMRLTHTIVGYLLAGLMAWQTGWGVLMILTGD